MNNMLTLQDLSTKSSLVVLHPLFFAEDEYEYDKKIYRHAQCGNMQH